jgi:hypothetical protein
MGVPYQQHPYGFGDPNQGSPYVYSAQPHWAGGVPSPPPDEFPQKSNATSPPPMELAAERAVHEADNGDVGIRPESRKLRSGQEE